MTMFRPNILALSSIGVVALFGLTILYSTSAPAQESDPIRFFDAAFVELTGRLDHEIYLPLQNAPAPGRAAKFRAKVFGPAGSVVVAVSDETATVLSTSTLTRLQEANGDSPEFYGVVTVPNQPFRLSLSGVSSSGEVFTIGNITSEPLVPQNTQITVTTAVNPLLPDTTNILYATISNNGAQDTFTAVPAGPLGITMSPASVVVHIGRNESATVGFLFPVPSGLAPLSSLDLSVSAISESSGEVATAQLITQVDATPGKEILVRSKSEFCARYMRSGADGLVAIALIGTNGLDPTLIDPTSILLAGVAPKRTQIRDVGTGTSSPCDRKRDDHELPDRKDGRPDLVAWFDMKQVAVATQGLGNSNLKQQHTAEYDVPVTARLNDATRTRCIGFARIQLRRGHRI